MLAAQHGGGAHGLDAWMEALRALIADEPEPASLAEAITQEPELLEPLMSYAATHLAEVPQEAKEALGLADDEAEEL